MSFELLLKELNLGYGEERERVQYVIPFLGGGTETWNVHEPKTVLCYSP